MAWHSKVLCLLFMSLSFNITFSMAENRSPLLATTSHLCHPNQSSALLQFKDSFTINKSSWYFCDRDQAGMASYPKTRYWKEEVDCCSWDGVTCDMLTGNVIGLDLSCSWIQGPFNSNNTLLLLPHLQTLNLSFNNFLGSIPASVGNLTKLTSLQLNFNNFTGQIPTSLSNLESLLELGIEGNNLYGVIPEIFHNLSNLVSIDLGGNQLSGQIPLSIFNLSNLVSIGLGGNQLSGQIPLSIFNLNQLTWLGLEDNHLSGPLPDHISGLSSLYYANLEENLLSGTLPSWLFSLPSLTDLYLSSNQFSSQIPELFSDSSLEYIEFRFNSIQGQFPNSFSHLVNASLINLSSNNISGTLNFKIFSKLRNLKILYLSFNNISLEFDDHENTTWPLFNTLGLSSCNITSFPTFLATQKRLTRMDLSYNRIQGNIPNWLSSLKSLESLDLRSNMIQGYLSSLINLFSVGLYFDAHMLLSSNNLTGEIPTSICNIISLVIIDFSHNNLSGAIPECLGSLNNLLVLNLRMNNFNGTIPQNFSTLRNLYLTGNQLEGSLPKSLANCIDLEILDIGNNKIQGGFPNWLESLPNLQVHILRSNRFHGSIGKPNSTTPFQMLRIMDISDNAFTGFLPKEYFRNMKALMTTKGKGTGVSYMGMASYQDSVFVTIKDLEIEYEKILTIFATIDFSRNNFIGHIPEIVGNFISLEGLNFSHNNLSGKIPLSLANMTALESLDLSSNALVSVIPQQLTNLNFLEVLNVSYNQLKGPIPDGGQFKTFKNDSYMGNSDLCGFPLSRKCGDGKTKPPPTSTTVQDEEDYIDWKIVMMGYATGLVIGLSMAYIVFTTRKPLWFVEMVERKLNEWSRRRNL